MCQQTTELMDATGSSETSTHVYQTARNYIPEGIVRSHCRRNQKSHKKGLIWQQHGYFVNTQRTAVITCFKQQRLPAWDAPSHYICCQCKAAWRKQSTPGDLAAHLPHLLLPFWSQTPVQVKGRAHTDHRHFRLWFHTPAPNVCSYKT